MSGPVEIYATDIALRQRLIHEGPLNSAFTPILASRRDRSIDRCPSRVAVLFTAEIGGPCWTIAAYKTIRQAVPVPKQ